MAITIQKRTRVLDTDEWGEWLSTTDSAPFINTTLVEYRVQEDVIIDSTLITNNVSTDANNVVSGDGFFDNLMETINTHFKAQYDQGYLIGTDYARAYTQMMGNVLSVSNQYAMSKDTAEAKAITAIEEAEVAKASRQDKIDLVSAQLRKTEADADYTEEQTTQLVRTVKDNRKIKSVDSLCDMYGTFGAGGVTVDDEMWTVLFNMIAELFDDLNDFIGTWDASAEAFPYSNDANEGDYVIVSADQTTSYPIDGYGVTGGELLLTGDIIYYKGGSWKKSTVALPASYTTTVVS